eukprot:COSAG01_NODE_3106_length_6575_cov_25.785207_3_plen_94_part_00
MMLPRSRIQSDHHTVSFTPAVTLSFVCLFAHPMHQAWKNWRGPPWLRPSLGEWGLMHEVCEWGPELCVSGALNFVCLFAHLVHQAVSGAPARR